MKFGVVSDIHGNLPALLAVVADAGGVAGWMNLGDIVSGPLWPAETAAWLMQQGWPTIAGNHERQVLTDALARMGATDRYALERLSPAQRAWMAGLPEQMTPARGLWCVHGTPFSDLVYLLESVTPAGRHAATAAEIRQRLIEPPAGTQMLLCGHSHMPREVRLEALQVVNPGSVGLQAFDHDWPHPHTVENHSPKARYALLKQGQLGWTVDLRAVAYDHEAAAAKAQQAGFADWAHALRTGRAGRTGQALSRTD